MAQSLEEPVEVLVKQPIGAKWVRLNPAFIKKTLHGLYSKLTLG